MKGKLSRTRELLLTRDSSHLILGIIILTHHTLCGRSGKFCSRPCWPPLGQNQGGTYGQAIEPLEVLYQTCRPQCALGLKCSLKVWSALCKKYKTIPACRKRLKMLRTFVSRNPPMSQFRPPMDLPRVILIIREGVRKKKT